VADGGVLIAETGYLRIAGYFITGEISVERRWEDAQIETRTESQH
jgi:hypothetical protein